MSTKKEVVNKEQKPEIDQAKLNRVTAKAQEMLEQTVVDLIFEEPFYANLIMGMRREFTVELPTLGVNVTDQVNLFVNPYFFAALPEKARYDVLKHECVFGETKVSTDRGLIKIKDIVNKQLKVSVLSISRDGELQYKPIISYSKQKAKNFPKKYWVSLKHSKSPYLFSSAIVTNDHRIAYLDNPLSKEIKYTKAENCENKYSIRTINLNRSKNKEHAQYNTDQIEVIVGMLLGDSCIYKKSFSSSGSKLHKSYADYKCNLLGGSTSVGISGYTGKMTSLKSTHPYTEQIEYLKEKFYPNNKKTVANVLDLITEKSLAFWYMDDGSWDKHGSSFLHTEGFSLSDNNKLKRMLKLKFGLNAEVKKRSNKNLYFLKFKKESTNKLHNIIAKFIHPSMNYKIPSSFHKEYDGNIINKTYLSYSVKRITQVKKLKGKKSALYDIGVADNHNFFANGNCVHNCHHVINNHFVRFRDLEPKIFENKKKSIFEKIEDMQKASNTNKAADAAINEYLPNLPKKVKMFDTNGNAITVPSEIVDAQGNKVPNPDKNAGMPVEAELIFVEFLKKKFPNIEHKQTTEYYYEFIKQQEEEDKKNGKGSSMDQYIVLDDHDIWHDSDATEDDITQRVKDAVNKAVEQTSDKDMGKVSGEILEAIEKLNHVPKDWRQDLQRFVARSSEILIENSRKKRNRRYGILYPGQKTYPKLSIIAAIDVSGSVGKEEAGQFFAEIERLHNMDINVHIIECDSEVQKEYKFDPKKPWTITGRGGTAFAPVFEKIEKDKMDCDGLLYFTDGCNWNETLKKPKYPVLWCLTSPYKLDDNIKFGAKTKVEIKKRVKR